MRCSRAQTGERRFGPRPIDIDLLTYDDLALNESDLTLPHPRLFERAFVLVPLAEIAPERLIAGTRRAGSPRHRRHREAAAATLTAPAPRSRPRPYSAA